MYECINAFKDSKGRMYYISSEITEEMYKSLSKDEQSNFILKQSN